MTRKIVEEKLVSIPEVREILDAVYLKMEENPRLNPDLFLDATHDYVHHFAKMSADSAKKVIKLLVSEYGMDESLAIQIANIDPNWPQELRIILEKDPTMRDLDNDKLTIIIQQIKDCQA